jgi:hypothetical protein
MTTTPSHCWSKVARIQVLRRVIVVFLSLALCLLVLQAHGSTASIPSFAAVFDEGTVMTMRSEQQTDACIVCAHIPPYLIR